VLLVRAPEHFEDMLVPVPEGARLLGRAGGTLDVVVCFCTRRADLERDLGRLLQALPPAGMFWAAWPKRTSGVTTDVTENTVREVALPLGMVDTKVIAIDPTWSALRLVRRKKLR
jgi:hypothetical protein